MTRPRHKLHTAPHIQRASFCLRVGLTGNDDKKLPSRWHGTSRHKTSRHSSSGTLARTRSGRFISDRSLNTVWQNTL